MQIKGKFIESYKTDWTSDLVKTFNHTLNSSDILVSLWGITDNLQYFPDEVEILDVNSISITVSEIPTGGLRVVVLGL